MTNNLLNAAVIGLGVGERHIEGYDESGMALVSVLCDVSESKLIEVSKRHPKKNTSLSPSDVLSCPLIDVVSIASPDNCHFAQIMKAIEYGKHIFVEKPLCLTREEFNQITLALDENPQVCLSSNFILRKSPLFFELKTRVQSGKLGEIYYLEGDYDYGRLHKLTHGWRGEIPFYSVMHGGGIHLIDLICWITQMKVVKVYAAGNKFSTANSHYQHNDFVVAILHFENGMIAKVSSNYGSVTKHGHKLCIYGTRGVFNYGHLGGFYSSSADPEFSHELIEGPAVLAKKGDMIPSFVKHIKYRNIQPDVTAQEVLDVMAVSLAIEESLQSKCCVEVGYHKLNRSR